MYLLALSEKIYAALPDKENPAFRVSREAHNDAMYAKIRADAQMRADKELSPADKLLANDKLTPEEQAKVRHQQTHSYRIASSSLTQLGMEVQPHSCNKVLFPVLSLLRYLQSCFQSEKELWMNGNPRSETLPDKIVRILLVLLSSYFFLFQSRFDILACPPLAKGKPGAIWYRAVSHRPEASVITYSHSLSSSFLFLLLFLSSFLFFPSFLSRPHFCSFPSPVIGFFSGHWRWSPGADRERARQGS